ncbi:hypothetical protein H4582DRAFT_2056896 [Lactarius indigo]|nr:hypothetical protein H4582DRAFT_2056896 [Lactarius indigo]
MADKRGKGERVSKQPKGVAGSQHSSKDRGKTVDNQYNSTRSQAGELGDTSYPTYTPAIVRFKLRNPNTTILGPIYQDQVAPVLEQESLLLSTAKKNKKAAQGAQVAYVRISTRKMRSGTSRARG